jgi:signal transduction histidine kinase/AraC-like DNA-binding protein
MHLKQGSRPTVGFLSTWSVYEGTTIDNYNHALLQGVCAAARDHDCNLLIGCGISLPGSSRASRTAWPVPGSDMDFVPVGPWNTDGLIIIPDDLSDSQFEYIQDLMRSGYPIILTTAERPGPLVAVDNAGGIRQAFEHLWQHGHRQIAFVAGKEGRGGDSAERLAAFRSALGEAGLREDGRLIAFGEHRFHDGRLAMQRILEAGRPFTAVLASNDLSGLGAVQALRAAGRRIPDDVAVIGFDDILEARSQPSPLTTVRHPTFMLGYQAVLRVVAAIRGEREEEVIRVPTQLIIRQSCGCRPEGAPVPVPELWDPAAAGADPAALAGWMAEAALVEVRRSPRQEVEALCRELLQAFLGCLDGPDPACFDLALQRIFEWTDAHGEDAHAWQGALSALRAGLPGLAITGGAAGRDRTNALIDRARLAVAENAQRQAGEALVRHMETSNRLGLMTSQLLAALDVAESAGILAEHLPQLGIREAVMALYTDREDDPVADTRLLLAVGLGRDGAGLQFPSRQFPPPDLFGETGFRLAILPLLIDERTTGFVALSATSLELCAGIVHNLAASLRSSQMYGEALDGRRLAEEANRLKSRFLSMVSHELRTPLSLIVGLSEIAMREKSAASSTMQRDIGQINLSAQHLARLIGDVLDLASSEAGQLRVLREPLDLAEVLRVAATIGEQMAREKGLDWEAHLPPHGPPVMGDRTRLRQVALNLISNAVKFTSQGKVVLGLAIAERQVIVSISDTGLGISPSDQEMVFREFYRSERTIRSGYGGLGLGLAISKQLIERHGGKIGLRSPGDLGTGSTFHFSLPILSPAVFDARLSQAPAQSASPVVVLSEGADGSTEQLCSFLRERGFSLRVCRVDQEVEWLAQVLSNPPAAIILSSRLAVRQGWEILEMLKRQAATDRVPVLTYSLDQQGDRGELLELNYMQKPLQPEQLIEELKRRAGSAAGRPTVLVVDDDPGILDLHCRLVTQIGGQPVTARNGREALDSLERLRPDLILLDLMMPEMDGFAVLDALRARQDWREIPVVVLTARVLSNADLERCNRGVAAVLSKGMFSAVETLHHIEAALARQHSLGKATQRLVRQATSYIHSSYAEALSREDIARHVGISADYLTDCFRQELGVTPMTYLRRYRIRQARELLETTDQSVMQVALAVGFSENAHFTRTFQREVGVTPRAYRSGKR